MQRLTSTRCVPSSLLSTLARVNEFGSGVWLAFAALAMFLAYSSAYKPPWYFVQLQHTDGFFALSAFLDPEFLNKGVPTNYFAQRTPWVALGWLFYKLCGDAALANLLFKHFLIVAIFLVVWHTIRTFADALCATIFASLILVSNQTTTWIGSDYAAAGALLYICIAVLAAVRLLNGNSFWWAFVAGLSTDAALVCHGYAAFILVPYAATAGAFFLASYGWKSCAKVVPGIVLGFAFSEVAFGSINFFLFGGKFWLLAHQFNSALANIKSGNDYSRQGGWWLDALYLAPHIVSYIICLIALTRLDELGKLRKAVVLAHILTMSMAIGLERRYNVLFLQNGYYSIFLFASTIPALAAVFSPAYLDRGESGLTKIMSDSLLAIALFGIYFVAGRAIGGSVVFFQASWLLAVLLLTILRFRARTYAFGLAAACLFIASLTSIDSLRAGYDRPSTKIQAAKLKELISMYSDIKAFHAGYPVVLLTGEPEMLPSADSLASLFLQTYGGSANLSTYRPHDPSFTKQDYFVLVAPSCDRLDDYKSKYFADRLTKVEKAPANNLCALLATSSRTQVPTTK